MKTVGLVISHKNNEKRRALLPEDLDKINNLDYLFLEKGYGESIGFKDSDYQGVNFVSRKEVLNCDVIVDVKLGDADYLNNIPDGKILCGWAHAVQNIDFTTLAVQKKNTVIAWENIFRDSRYIFYRNREIAGEAAILQGIRYAEKMPYETKVAVIGNGQVAKGALRILHGLGANVDLYNKKLEKTFIKNMYKYDVLVNCVLWDTKRTDKLIYKEDLKKMKPGTLIIDISCDPYLEIETSHPTTIDNPVYTVDNVIHYAVDNTPAMFSKSVSKVLSNNFASYFDELVTENYSPELQKAVAIAEGKIVDDEIIKFRALKGIN
jgi:N5-(carboxyethyl)ornithine synthase